jgi:glycogen operon protein
MPIHQFVHDGFLLARGLKNYWGYNSIGFFAPHAEYASQPTSGGQITEFREMVKALHRAGLEVILDVVYNHTAEGNERGPTLCFRGIDNRAYYRLSQENLAYYMDYTGTGNSLNMRHPNVLQLIMDSLRYWVLRCTSTASASISRRRSRASCTTSIGCPRSSISFSRTRC